MFSTLHFTLIFYKYMVFTGGLVLTICCKPAVCPILSTVDISISLLYFQTDNNFGYFSIESTLYKGTSTVASAALRAPQSKCLKYFDESYPGYHCYKLSVSPRNLSYKLLRIQVDFTDGGYSYLILYQSTHQTALKTFDKLLNLESTLSRIYS